MNSSDRLCPHAVDEVFGPFVQGCRQDFDFTLTFEQAFLSIAPSTVLILAGVWRLPLLTFRRKRLIEANTFKWLKVVTAGAFATLQLGLVILWGTRSSMPAQKIGIAAATLSFLASITLCLLSPLEHAKSLTPSTLICSYLLLTLIFDATMLRTLWIFSFDEQVRRVFSASFSLKTIILLLEAKEKREFASSNDDKIRSPEEFSGIYGRSLYWWLNSLIRTGFKKVLIHEELYRLPVDIEAHVLARRFQDRWNKSRSTSKHKISFVLLSTLKWHLTAPIVPRLLLLAFTFCQPLLLQRFLSYLQDPIERTNVNIGYGFIGAYFLTYLGMAISSGMYWLLTYRSLVMVRGMLVGAIYSKTTTIDIAVTSDAKAMTLMGTDAERIVRGLMDFHELWASILQVAFATWLLTGQLGAAAAGPVAVCLLSVAATIWAGTMTTGRQLAWITAIQERIGMTSSVLGSMKSIRSSGLAAKAQSMVHKLRLNEIKNARRFWFLGAFSSTIALIPQMISPVVTFAIFTASSVAKNKTLDFSRMFTSLALLILLTQPLFNLFAGLIDFVAAIGCFHRINDYLAAESRQDKRKFLATAESPRENAVTAEAGESAIEVRDITVIRSKEGDTRPTLNAINITVPRSNITLLIGPVASGKSTLLKTLLGEIQMTSGEVLACTKEIAYCDQSPWLFNGTFRENIVAFSSFDQNHYQKTLQACALESDLRELQAGDATRIGSRGFTLSSGQKQRIAIARAVYSRKSLMLFDDVLSQLDRPTQIHIFAHLFGPGGLLREAGTSVVLATHAVNFLPFADNVIALDGNGAIKEQGSYTELRAREAGYVSKLYRDHKIDREAKLPTPFHPGDVIITPMAKPDTELEISHRNPTSPDTKASQSPPDATRQQGDTRIYLYYFSCLGWLLTIFFFLLQIAFAFFTVFPNIWLKWWAGSNGENPNAENARYTGGYVGLQVAGLVSSGVLTWFSFNIMAQKVGLELHTKILRTIIHAPMSLFSTTDTGSITTKFSQDFELVDSKLPLALMCVVTNLLITIGQAGLIASASAWIALSFPFLMAVFYFVQRYYLRTSRQIRLLDLEQKAPLYTQFTESIEGLITLRAFNWQAACITKNHTLVDNSQRPFYLLYMIQKWLALVLDLIVTGLAVVVVGTAVTLRNTASVGFTGVSLSQIISLTSYLKLIILFWTQMETSLGAVTRIKSFCEGAGDENSEDHTQLPPTEWPETGGVDIQGLSVTYRNSKGDTSQTALKDVSLSIGAGTKVGICGRTGSGKTTLLLALLKLVDSEGSIMIDNIDLQSIPRQLLRERIIAVSDDAFHLPGATLRENLDPLAYCPDDDTLRKILSEVLLWDVFTRSAQGSNEGSSVHMDPLDLTFTSSTLSHGQNQLFALARAMVRQSARRNDGGLVILDEATSRTDKDTDAIIQRVIRDWFRGCTLIVIAHRLESIMDFDKVIVLDKGSVVEVGKPEDLSKRVGGVFWNMLGSTQEERLAF